jgi:hypothetical protein
VEGGVWPDFVFVRADFLTNAPSMNWQQASKLQELTKSIQNLVETTPSIQIPQGMHTPKHQLAHLA